MDFFQTINKLKNQPTREDLGYGNLDTTILGLVAFGIGLGIVIMLAVVLYLIF